MCKESTHCVLFITCIRNSMVWAINSFFFLTNWEFDSQQFWAKINYFFLFFWLNLLQNYNFLLNISHRYGGVFFFLCFFRLFKPKFGTIKLSIKWFFSLGLTWPSYSHNVPNLSPQVFSPSGYFQIFFLFCFFQRIEKSSFYQVLKLWIPILTFCPCTNTLNHKVWEAKHGDP